jgi:LacI family transcriptional regulator
MSRTKKRSTNRDVAELAGVSTAVVSYVFNDGPRPVSAEIRTRVLEAAQALDYHPSAIARGLRKQTSSTIGFIVKDFTPQNTFLYPYTAGILTGLVDELKQHDYYLIVFPIGVGESVEQLRDLLRERRLDGVVVRFPDTPSADDQLLELLASSRLPSVFFERTIANHPSITIDEVTGATLATEYLIQQGHRRIAHIVGDLRMQSARTRLDSYTQTLSRYGIPYDPELVQGRSWYARDGAEAAHRLFDLVQTPTAIFAANDTLAYSAIQVAHERGLCVPQDVAILGYDDAPVENAMSSSLTTMQIPLEDMGRQAAKMILQLVAGETIESLVFTPKLVKRHTA